METMTQEHVAIASSISKWTWARKQYISSQIRLGKSVSQFNARDPAVIQREIIELLRTRDLLLKKALTQKDIERFHRKYVRSQMTRMAKRETLNELLKDELNPYDLAMALEIPVEDAIEALLSLERSRAIKPISSESGPVFMGRIHLELNPDHPAAELDGETDN